jgi:hypothetical protein
MPERRARRNGDGTTTGKGRMEVEMGTVEIPVPFCPSYQTTQELQPHVVEILSRTPLKLVVAHSYDKQIIYAKISTHTRRNEGNDEETRHQITYDTIVVNASPIKIMKYVSPVTTTITKYDITFESPTGIRLTTGPSTIDEILSLLKSNGYVYDLRAVEKVLPVILNGYYRDNKMEIRSELETPGFYLIDGKVQAYGYTPRDYTEQEVIESAKVQQKRDIC